MIILFFYHLCIKRKTQEKTQNVSLSFISLLRQCNTRLLNAFITYDLALLLAKFQEFAGGC